MYTCFVSHSGILRIVRLWFFFFSFFFSPPLAPSYGLPSTPLGEEWSLDFNRLRFEWVGSVCVIF